MRQRLLGLFSLTCALACGEADFTPELAQLEQPIVQGEATTESDDATVYVLTRTSPTDGSACTGTLIAPNLVVTALHCVTEYTFGTFYCDADGTLRDDTSTDGRIGNLVEPSNVQIFTGSPKSLEPAAAGADLIGTGSNQICRNDLAFIVLDRDVHATYPALRLESRVRFSESLRAVGYGGNGVDRMSRGGLRVLEVGPVEDGEAIGTAAPRTFVVNEGPCHGDSGGPAFAEETGALVGVYSLNASPSCEGQGIRNVYTHLSPFSTLVLDAFAAAGAEPLLEDDGSAPAPPPAAADSGCSLAPVPSSARGAGLGWLTLLAAASSVALRRRRH